MRKVFPVIIHEKQYWVWDIEGKEHSGLNDTIKTWWLYYSDDPLSDLTPPIDSSYWEPFNVSINRRCWDIQFKQRNYSKHKWGETDFRNSTRVEMLCNNKTIYAFTTTGNNSGLSFAFAKVQYLMVILSEHCFNFFEPETENGRRVYWYGLPATIRVNTLNTWEIGIVPDYNSGLSKEEWWSEYKRRKTNVGPVEDEDDEEMENEDYLEDMCSDYINWGDALSDQHITWFRK